MVQSLIEESNSKNEAVLERPAPWPIHEPERLRVLRDHRLLDTEPEHQFDEITALASYFFNTPIAIMPLLDESRQWFKSKVGLTLAETPREHAFCGYTILQEGCLVVPDALNDPRFSWNPLVREAPGIRFYAGTPLRTREGHALGTLCLIDTKARHDFDEAQQAILHLLGRKTMAMIEVRHYSHQLTQMLTLRKEPLREHVAELNRTNQAKDHFLAVLGHELRNPLAPIVNAVELLRSPEPGDALEIIERQVKQMAGLLEDLLDHAKVTRGIISLHKSKVDLAKAVREGVRTARASASLASQPFALSIPSKPIWVEGDPVRIEQIIDNLLINAAKYTTDPANQEITVSLKCEKDQAVLRVKDRGVGIAPEMLERIFEPFTQIERTRSQSRGGLGLGLSLVRQLVISHGGSVSAHSQGIGTGAEFVVSLPLAEPPAGLPPRPSAPSTRSRNSANTPPLRFKSRILIVDDNIDFGHTLKRLLTAWGYTVEVATNGKEAAPKALEFQPDVAFIDLGLPGQDGYAVALQFAGLPKLKKVPLIALSGYGQESDRVHATQVGFKEYLVKPVDPGMIRQRLAEMTGC